MNDDFAAQNGGIGYRRRIAAIAVAVGLGITGFASPSLAATAAARSARLVAAPATVSFGSVQVGGTATAVVTVSNTGSVATGRALHAHVTGTGYAVAGDACSGHRLGPAATCRVRVSFSPAAGGAQLGILTVTAGALAATPVALTGRGVVAAQLAMTPGSQAFPATYVGQRTDLVQFTVTNTGGEPAGAITTSRPGPDFAVFADTCSGVALASGASCSYQVAFTPHSRGDLAGTLTASATPGGVAQAALLGTGLAAAQLTVTGSQAFPDTTVGGRSDPVTYTVTNLGDQASGPITRAAFTGSDFTVTADGCSGQSLAPAASCSISVAFTPQAYGPRTDVLSVSAAPGGGVNLPLAGTGLGTPSLAISPNDYSFPDTPVGTNSLVQVFRVTNDGTGPAWFNDYGTSADIYSVYFARELAPEGCTFGQELDPGQSCNVAAAAFPHVTGPLAGVLYAKFFANPDAVSGTEYDAQAVLHVTGL